MADGVKQILQAPIQLADQVTKLADDVHSSFRADCAELKSKTDRLAALLRQAARADLYERPTRRIMDDTEQVLEKALSLVCKCRAAHGLVKRVFTIIPAAAFKKMSSQLENSIGDVSWLLRRRRDDDDDDDGYLGLPPIASNEPILCLIWEQIAKLHNGSLEDRADAAASLVSLARDNDRYGKLIIEEGGIGPLLKLVKEGRAEGQESAARAIGLLGRDPESVDQMLHAGVCTVFAKVLKEGPMNVQAMVAWAVAELAVGNPKCQDLFAQNNVIRLLVSHLAFETVQEHSKYAIPSKAKMSIHSVVLANNTSGGANGNGVHHDGNNAATDDEKHPEIRHPIGSNGHTNKNQMHTLVQSTMGRSSSESHPVVNGGNVSKQHQRQSQQQISLSGASLKGREFEDPATKATMKAMAAKALWLLAKGNPAICRSITESKALLCFAVLLEKGPDEVQYNSAMALMEIARVAEKDADLRRSAFKPNSPACKAVVDQILRVVEKADSQDLLLPCITAIGCLSRTFRATETRVIAPLVRLLDEKEEHVSREAVIALTKFACSENYLHVDHSKAIIAGGGAGHLVQLVYLGEEPALQIDSLVLLCYIAHHVPDDEALSHAEALTVLEWASKQGFMVQDQAVDKLLAEAKARLELYQSRGSRGFP
ncbi:unnamed protein product [Spirodela intermedia]|uniref:DUF7792 domain-containing protein n=1 Tax=Spirodela intermedia TaxID=51605 RepID=A0A7I8JTI2_SPIIN|nr:unnamed protein product [Spirodela intermedia]CAA6673497.1 unnamed protein product [Spirodela intermedia]